eukprot:EG_transcript_2554
MSNLAPQYGTPAPDPVPSPFDRGAVVGVTVALGIAVFLYVAPHAAGTRQLYTGGRLVKTHRSLPNHATEAIGAHHHPMVQVSFRPPNTMEMAPHVHAISLPGDNKEARLRTAISFTSKRQVGSLTALLLAGSVATASVAFYRRFGRPHPSVVHMAALTDVAPSAVRSLEEFANHCDPSWIQQLKPDPEQEKHAPNKSSRKVRSGHYVLVHPTPLPRPELLTYSRELAAELGLDDAACRSDAFLRFFSGDSSALPQFYGKTWATPYALSIYGEEMYHNCPFGTGEGYGDGRAITVAEVALATGQRWELQLKGGGTTPFCRGGDGRAVLRSSVREFLASECMHHLGVPTTRALSLIVSREETVERPWYSNQNKPQLPSLDDPRLASYPPHVRQLLLEQVKEQFRNPDRMATEPCAITCRAATSFLRVGHVELYGRRARGAKAPPPGPERERNLEELRDILRHALFREYPECLEQHQDFEQQVLAMVRAFSERLAALTADWVRVGFVQGNFNSDNCLVGGRTMDYGPFGFIERFQPLWNMWTGGGEKFGFLNQHVAGEKNFGSFVTAVLPALSQEGVAEAQRILGAHRERATAALHDVWRRKLGFQDWGSEEEAVAGRLLQLMEDSEADYTMLWRQLAELPAAGRTGTEPAETLRAPLADVFYRQLDADLHRRWGEWLVEWLQRLQAQGLTDGAAVADGMRRVSPKYIPREWMLVQAYSAGTTAAIEELYELFRDPYGLTPESQRWEERFYRKTPPETYAGVGVGGTAFMSCSS